MRKKQIITASVSKNLSNAIYLVRCMIDYLFVPKCLYRWRLENILTRLTPEEAEAVNWRVDYYNRLNTKVSLKTSVSVKQYRFPFFKKKRYGYYYFNLYTAIKHFNTNYRFQYLFGDITQVPDSPKFVKSRPIHGDNTNSIVMKLDAQRHFHFLNDTLSFRAKKDMLVSRTTWANGRPWRRKFVEQFLNHPMCDVGKTRQEKDEDFPESIKPYMSFGEQLQYKFIACIEGVDVATNLKWVMSSNSVAVSPPMKYETWFMEGQLIPNYHYIEVKPDYSDLIEKLQHYINHPDEAESIIDHAHEYVQQFIDKRLELATQLAVVQKYFNLTND